MLERLSDRYAREEESERIRTKWICDENKRLKQLGEKKAKESIMGISNCLPRTLELAGFFTLTYVPGATAP